MFLGAKPNVADGVSRSGDVHSTLSWWRRESGQAMVEMAVSAGALLLLLFGGLQMAVILNAVLAVSQYSYAGARYAAVHGTGQTASSYGSTLQSNVTAPPTIAGAV
jgi:Flp pilus assembly protein TadG